MQFIDLQAQYQNLKGEIDGAVQNVLNNSNYIMGQEVRTLEEKLAEYVGVKHCVTCANGTDALTLAMMAYDLKEGDGVFVPTFTFYASAETISLCGATPIFVDIDRQTFNISLPDLEGAIEDVIEGKYTTKEGKPLTPRAIIAVDLFGLPANFAELNNIAEKYNLLVIEDGAQGFGGSVEGKMACSFGDIGTTSFFPAKPLGCYGDGGAVFTNEDKVKAYLESIKVHGKGNDKYDNVRVGLNSRLDTIQAAVLLPKLKAFQEYELQMRNAVAKGYKEGLQDVAVTPLIPDGFVSSFAQYSILLKSEEERDHVQQTLKQANIPTMIYYKKSMHEQTVYRNNPSIYRGFPMAEQTSKVILNLPMHPYLSEEDQGFIIKTIKKAMK
ncbi:MAG: DegT/DnrJ/EryC1/StrS aminotransferase family protein [Anaerovorax sp.]